MSPRWSNVIDARRARLLKQRHGTWKKAGIAMVKEQGRATPYTSYAMYRAVYDYRRGRRSNLPGMDGGYE